MKCPICKLSEISENNSNCPNCNADLDFINNIKDVSKKCKTNKLFLVLLFSALIISILISLYTINKNNGSKKENSNAIIEQLKQENAALKNEISEIKKLQVDTLKISNNQNSVNKVETDEYIVQKNDNLWIIAQKFYGDGFKFKNIASENNIEKPYEILIGSRLIIRKNK